MKSAVAVCAVLLLSACGSETFEERSEHLARAICSFAEECLDRTDYDNCYQDVVTDMGDAQEELDAAGEEACMKCMEVKIKVIEQAVDDCSNYDLGQITEACGETTKDACAGYP